MNLKSNLLSIEANKLARYLSIALFICSLTQAAFCVEGDCQSYWSGLCIVITGPLGFWLSPAGFSWLANPALLIAWLSVNKDSKRSLIASIVATLFALCFLVFKTIISDEGGLPHQITGYQIGYWLWLMSSIVMLGGNLQSRFSKNKNV